MEVEKADAEGAIASKIVSFAIPLFLSNVLQALNGSINSMWVGHYLGEVALAATSIGNSVVVFLAGSTFGITMAATICVAHCVGIDRVKEAKRVAGTVITLFAVISICVSAVGLTFSESILTLLKTPTQSFPLAVSYMRIYVLALPTFFAFASVVSALRGAGDFKTPFYFSLLSVLVDILLNPILIFGIGPIPGIGIIGSAFASVTAQGVSFIGLVLYLYRIRHPLRFEAGELSMLRPDWNILGTLIRKGVPISGHILVVSLNGVLMLSLVDNHGVDTVAAFGASMQIWNYIPMLALAVSTSASTLAAQRMSANDWRCVDSIARRAVLFSVTGTLVLVLFVEVLDAFAFELLLPSHSPALNIATHINRIVTWSWVIAAISPVLFGVIRAAGEVMAPLLIALVTVLAVQFPLAYTFQYIWRAEAIWWSYPTSATLNLALAVLYYMRGRWRRSRALDTPLSLTTLP